ncbi:MAG: hypothetical protein NZV61_06245, partial [Candidatus Bipolaricaulota bacterium]|nr:hypothetical protein [Candidatus Bipolaricaulota bacterium]
RNVLSQAAIAPLAFGDLAEITAEGAWYSALGDRRRKMKALSYSNMGLEQLSCIAHGDTLSAQPKLPRNKLGSLAALAIFHK